MTLEEKVKEIVVDGLHCNADEVKMEADLVNDLGADSLDQAELMMNIEDAFKDHLGADSNISETDVEKLKTVGSIVEYLRGRGVPDNL